MINWQPIETEPEESEQKRVYSNGIDISSRYHRLSPRPTHWAPINLPGDHQCDTCRYQSGDGVDCSVCDKRHDQWEQKI